MDSLLAAIRDSEAHRADTRQQFAALDQAPRSPKRDENVVRATLRGYVADYRKLLRGHVPQMQQILRRLIVGKLTFTPMLNGDYEFVGKGTVRPLLSGVIRHWRPQGDFSKGGNDVFGNCGLMVETAQTLRNQPKPISAQARNTSTLQTNAH